MLILFRIYKFKRRCGYSRRHSFMTAVRTVLRDIKLRRFKL